MSEPLLGREADPLATAVARVRRRWAWGLARGAKRRRRTYAYSRWRRSRALPDRPSKVVPGQIWCERESGDICLVLKRSGLTKLLVVQWAEDVDEFGEEEFGWLEFVGYL